MKRTPLARKTRLRKRRLKLRGEVSDKDLDAACRAVVFARDGYKCRKLGTTEHLQWAHVYSRRYKSIRWDPDNSLCLSAGAHLWWHSQPVAASLWWVEQVGEAFHQKLRLRMHAAGKIDRKLLLVWLQQQLKWFERRTA